MGGWVLECLLRRGCAIIEEVLLPGASSCFFCYLVESSRNLRVFLISFFLSFFFFVGQKLYIFPIYLRYSNFNFIPRETSVIE